MRRLFLLSPSCALGLYIILDLICVGMGMGVPIFCILIGPVIGWHIGRRLIATVTQTKQILRKALLYAAITSAATFIIMAILWGRWLLILFDPGTDYINLGIPMILYDPKASFIGWQVLMIVISPFLQFLMTLFGLHLTLLVRLRDDGPSS